MNRMISITTRDQEDKIVTIQDCLDHFSLKEKLEKGNEVLCEKCNKAQNMTRKIEVFYAPKYLIVFLKRFQTKFLDKTKIQLLKNNSRVSYPVNSFNLTEYVNIKDPNPVYDLYSVCQHSGSTEGGHYASACRNFGKWYEFDDASVFPSDEDIIVSPEGYMLFYRRK